MWAHVSGNGSCSGSITHFRLFSKRLRSALCASLPSSSCLLRLQDVAPVTGIEAIAEKLTHVQYEGLDMLDGAVDSMNVPAPEGSPAGTEQVSEHRTTERGA